MSSPMLVEFSPLSFERYDLQIHPFPKLLALLSLGWNFVEVTKLRWSQSCDFVYTQLFDLLWWQWRQM